MNAQVNWQKIRDELQRLADVDKLKSEVHRIGTELRKFDLNKVLSPKAQDRVKKFEQRYTEVVKRLGQAQGQVDREVGKLLKQISTHRADVTKVMNEQKVKLDKIKTELKARFQRHESSPANKTTATSTSKTASTAAAPKRAKAKASPAPNADGVARRGKRAPKATRKGRATQ